MWRENMAAGEEEVICRRWSYRILFNMVVFGGYWPTLRELGHAFKQWTKSDFRKGLPKLWMHHALHGAVETITGDVVRDRAQLREMLDWLRWASAAYEKDRPTLVATLQLADRDVARMVVKSAYYKPAYFIAVNHVKKHVVMSIRGTYNAFDILTDLSAKNKPFLQGTAHSGMLRAAKWILKTEGPLLTRLLAENPEYMLVLTGHSLGAAVATLLSMILHSTGLGCDFQARPGIHPSRITCWGFGCAPCVDRSLAETAESFVRNVVLQNDVVPRMTLAALEELHEEIEGIHYHRNIFRSLVNSATTKVLERVEQLFEDSSIMMAAREARSSVDQMLQEARAQHGPAEGDSDSDSWREEESTSSSIATRSQTRKHNLEARRFYVPGLLYHILRQKIAFEDRQHNAGSKYKHQVVRSTDPASRFGRIVLSKRFLRDHFWFSIRDGIIGAMESC